MTLKLLRRWYVLPLISGVVILVVLLLVLPQTSPLLLVSSDVRYKIAAQCTHGTNHEYYYGDAFDRILDPAIRRWSDTNAYRLRVQTTEPGTVVWVRLKHPAFGTPPPLVPTATGPVRMPGVGALRQFRARLIEGRTNRLLDIKTSMQSYKGSYYVGGWLLPGSLQDYRDGVLRIESTNGTEILTLRIR